MALLPFISNYAAKSMHVSANQRASFYTGSVFLIDFLYGLRTGNVTAILPA